MDGTIGDRLRAVDHRIWDALLAAVALGAGILGFALRQRSPGEPPDWLGYAMRFRERVEST